MKTDLTKILSVSGQSGLFRYVAQAKNGVIAEALSDGKRSPFGMKSKITTMEDISIYTGDGETKLRVVFEKMRDSLSGEAAPTSKASADELKEFFGKVLPDYDRDRFYVSHMKKVVSWYNCLKQYASLDFENPGDEDAARQDDAVSGEE